jgi:hypothetical protein
MMGKPIISDCFLFYNFSEVMMDPTIIKTLGTTVGVISFLVVFSIANKKFKANFWNRIFRTYLTSHMKQYQGRVRHSKLYHIPEVTHIAANLLNVLNYAVEKDSDRIVNHAHIHKTLFIEVGADLKVHVYDKNLYMAIDLLKQMFYDAYGVYLDAEDKASGIRNNIDVAVTGPEGTEEVSPFDYNFYEVLDEKRKGSTLPESVFLIIRMSVVTPYMMPNYSYRNYWS